MYSHRCSPKTYTQPQLFACLVLKEFLKLDYRKLAGLLRDTPDLCKAIELTKVPHFTTFQKAAERLLLAAPARRLLDTTIHVGAAVRRIKRRVDLAALDGTGFESRHASSYYVRRRETGGKYRGKYHSLTYRRFPKAGILCDCASHMILAVVPSHGPAPDILHFREALDQARRRVRIVTLAADAGYDSEASHEYARQQHGIRSLIPPLIGRRTEKPPAGYWRRQMKARLGNTRYSLLKPLASGNGKQHAQTPVGFRPKRAKTMEPISRNRPPSIDTQPNDPETMPGFLQSRTQLVSDLSRVPLFSRSFCSTIIRCAISNE
jgi:hypothetical protein